MDTHFRGLIEVICGSMFSGKTEELLRRLRRAEIARQRTQVFKPLTDNRFSKNHIQSHNQSKTKSIAVEKAYQILELVKDQTRVVGIDEAQFFDDKIIEVSQKLAFRGVRVILAGLDLDFRGQPFGPMPQLMAIAEKVTKLSAVCVVCGNAATRSQRICRTPTTNSIDLEQQIVIGASESYEARCRFCHEPEAIVLASDGLKTELANHLEPAVESQA